MNLDFAYLALDRGQEALAPLKLAVELQPECLEAQDLLPAKPEGPLELFYSFTMVLQLCIKALPSQ